MAKPPKVNKNNNSFPPKKEVSQDSSNENPFSKDSNANSGMGTPPSSNDPSKFGGESNNPFGGLPGEEFVSQQKPGDPNSPLLKVYTKHYQNQPYSQGMYYATLNPNRPMFTRLWIQAMMRDPHVWYGMELLKGPIISKAKFIVEADNQEVADYVQRQIDNFWNRGITKAIDCLIWGYACSEVIYEFNEEQNCIDFKDLRYLQPRDVRPVTKDGALTGVEIRNTKDLQKNGQPKYLGQKKVLWTVHDKKTHRWFGRSRLEGAFDSWWEIWQPKGYRGIRHLWFYKNAFSGGVLYYPDGTTEDPMTGEQIPNVVLATQMMDRKETGSSIALPNKTGDSRDWEWEDAKSNAIPEGLMEYGDYLRDEIWEGLGVPPEVARTEDSGGFAGRRVPQQAFYSYLQEIANEFVYDFDEQILKNNLVKLAFGKVSYKITPVSILQTLQEEEMGLVTGKLPGDEGAASMEEDEEEVELDENGEPIEDEEIDPEDTPFGGENGKVEDRKSNAFNLSEKAQKNKKK